MMKLICVYLLGAMTPPAGFVIYFAIDWFRTDRESSKGSNLKGPIS